MCTSSTTSVASFELPVEFHSSHRPRCLSSQCGDRLPPADGSIGLSPRFERPTDNLSQFEATFGPASVPVAYSLRAAHDATAGGLGESAIYAKLDSLEREMARLKCAEPARIGTPARLARATEALVPALLPSTSQSSQMREPLLPASRENGALDGQLDAIEREVVRMKATAACGPCAGVTLIAGGLTAGYSAQPGPGFAEAAVQFQRAERERLEKEDLLATHVDLIDLMKKQSESYGLLMSAHKDLMMAHKMQGAQMEDATKQSARRRQRAW